ncbi:MAG: class I SAM-dependent methyltransferase [Muribaculaceae bacterium]|nr:class I SAM-dependent methyltransferase [Muribaculaceae bacterium]
MEFNQEYLDFVRENAGADPATLRLRLHKDSRPWIPMAINNIAALKKSRKFRLAEDADLTPRVIPLEVSAQQATSARVALLHANLAGNATTVLDMTFGLGMDARLLAMDSGRRIIGFDLREELAAAAKVNFADFPNVEVRLGDSVAFLENYRGEPFDLIFIDPARRGKEGERLYNLHDCQPDLIEILPLIRRNSRRLMAKLSPMLDVSQTLRDLPGITSLHIVEEGNECKELLAIVDFEKEAAVPEIVIDRFARGEFRRFSFTIPEERDILSYPWPGNSGRLLDRMPRPGEYLLEPSAATMKAAPFNLLSQRFATPMLHPNTHLYVSPANGDGAIPANAEDFPGNTYLIEQALPLTSSNLKMIARNVGKAEIAVRNLKGFTSDGLRKRLKTKPGGDLKLYAVTIAAGGGDTQALLLVRPTGK